MKTPTNTLISSYRLNIPGFLHLAWTANKISCHQGMHFRSLLCSKEGNYFFFPLSHVYSWKKSAKWIFCSFFLSKIFRNRGNWKFEAHCKEFSFKNLKVNINISHGFLKLVVCEGFKCISNYLMIPLTHIASFQITLLL